MSKYYANKFSSVLSCERKQIFQTQFCMLRLLKVTRPTGSGVPKIPNPSASKIDNSEITPYVANNSLNFTMKLVYVELTELVRVKKLHVM